MLRKSITYKNFDSVTVTEEYFFHLSKADILKLEATMPGGFAETLQSMGALDPKQGNNAALILQTFETLLEVSFGKKTPDGRFVKRVEDWEEFRAGDAYSELFMELVTDASYAAKFVKGILPADFDTTGVDDAAAVLEGSVVEHRELPESEVPAWIRERREPTMSEVNGMSKAELTDAMRAKLTGKFPGDPE